MFIVLFVSGSACAVPILAVKVAALRIPPIFLFLARHFGTGVLIATAFVHLLPTAFILLGDPCLSNFWTTDYPAMPGAIALAAIFFVTVIEMIFSPAQHMCGGHQPELGSASNNTPSSNRDIHSSHDTESKKAGNAETRPKQEQDGQEDTRVSLREFGPLYGRSSSISRVITRMGEGNDRTDDIVLSERENRDRQDGTLSPKETPICEETSSVGDDVERNSHHSDADESSKKAVMQCVLLEVGILFHSVFIGMSLSVSTGRDFVVLLIAITFHRKYST